MTLPIDTPASSDTPELDDTGPILRKLVVKAQEEALTNTENITMLDEAKAAIRLHYRQRVLAALPEKKTGDDVWLKNIKSFAYENGYNQAVDEFVEALLGIFGEEK